MGHSIDLKDLNRASRDCEAIHLADGTLNYALEPRDMLMISALLILLEQSRVKEDCTPCSMDLRRTLFPTSANISGVAPRYLSDIRHVRQKTTKLYLKRSPTRFWKIVVSGKKFWKSARTHKANFMAATPPRPHTPVSKISVWPFGRCDCFPSCLSLKGMQFT